VHGDFQFVVSLLFIPLTPSLFVRACFGQGRSSLFAVFILFHRTDIPYVLSLSQYVSDPLFSFFTSTKDDIYTRVVAWISLVSKRLESILSAEYPDKRKPRKEETVRLLCYF